MIQLSDDQLAGLRELQPAITALKAELAKAERAGVDVTGPRETLEKTESTLKGLLREYGRPKTRVARG